MLLVVALLPPCGSTRSFVSETVYFAFLLVATGESSWLGVSGFFVSLDIVVLLHSLKAFVMPGMKQSETVCDVTESK